jgi:hypothetical protein
LPLFVLAIEHDFKRRRPAGHANLELGLAAALAEADDATLASERDPLGPGALRGFSAYGFSE